MGISADRWQACPGVLVRRLPEQPTKEVLSALASDPKMVAILSGPPLGRFELSGRVPDPTWKGSYWPASGDLVVNPFRPLESYGKEFHPPVLKSVSEAGRTLVEAIARSLYHELGHHVLYAAGPKLNGRLRISFEAGGRCLFPFAPERTHWSILRRASRRTGSNRFEDSFADRDPEGYHMVEAILRLAGKK